MSVRESKYATVRKRNILYLIENYLKEAGFMKTASCLQEEANLQNDFIVCDNLNLENIVVDYETYYYIRFQSYPSLCKKVSRIVVQTADAQRTNKKHVVAHIRSKVHNKRAPSSADDSNKDVNLSLALNTNNSNVDTATTLPMLTFQTKDEVKKKVEVNNGGNCKVGVDNEWTEYANIISKVVQTNDGSIKWDDVKGLNEAKEVLKECIIYPVKYPHLFNSIITPWKSILLYGPPGTGKTMLGKAVCGESGAKFFNVSSSVIINKWRGDSEKLIRVLFELAGQQSPSVICIEEIDCLVSKRNDKEHEASRRFKSELFNLIDDVLYSNKGNLFLLATSNLPWDIDEAMIRRFEKRLLIGMPNVEAREQMLKKYLPEILNEKLFIKCDVNYNRIAVLTERYSGSDIKCLSKQIIMDSIKEYFALAEKSNHHLISKYKKTIKNKDVEEVLGKMNPSVSHLESRYMRWRLNHK